MNDDQALIRRLVAGDEAGVREVLDRSGGDGSALSLVTAALVAEAPGDLLQRASQLATSTRDRQLVAIAGAHLDGDTELLGGLIRDHLVDHPDSLLAVWIATQRSSDADH